MGPNARRIYDQKLEDSKGPSFDLVGTGLANNMTINESKAVNPSSLYRKQNHSVGRSIVSKKIQKGSHSVRPNRDIPNNNKLDFNLSGVNIPVQQNEKPLKSIRPPLPGKRIRGPHKFKNDDLKAEFVLTNSSVTEDMKSNKNIELNLSSKIPIKKSLTKSKLYFLNIYLGTIGMKPMRRNTKLRIARDVENFNKFEEDKRLESLKIIPQSKPQTTTGLSSNTDLDKQLENMFPEIKS